MINDAMAINQQFDGNHLALAANSETYGEIFLRRQDYVNAKQRFRQAQNLRDAYMTERETDGTM